MFCRTRIYVDETNNSLVGKKQPAIWDQNTTLALLSIYEAKMEMLDHPKKKGKIWEAISTALKQDFGIEMSMDQIRWKINALIKKYKECVDNNWKSGRSLMTFKWFDQMDEIFNQGKDAIANCFSSKLVPTISKPSTSCMKKVHSKSATSTSISRNNSNTSLENYSNENLQNTSVSTSSTLNTKPNNKRATNHNIARDKVALENQWSEYMKMKIERDKVSYEKLASTLEQKKDMLKLKRKHLCLKEEIKQRKEYFKAKLQGKENRHAEIIRIEKEKCRLLKKVLKISSSDSD